MVVGCRHGLRLPGVVLVRRRTTDQLACVCLNSRGKHYGHDQHRDCRTAPHGRYSNSVTGLLQGDPYFAGVCTLQSPEPKASQEIEFVQYKGAVMRASSRCLVIRSHPIVTLVTAKGLLRLRSSF